MWPAGNYLTVETQHQIMMMMKNMPRIRQRVWVKLKILRTPRLNDPWQVLLKLPVCVYAQLKITDEHWLTFTIALSLSRGTRAHREVRDSETQTIAWKVKTSKVLSVLKCSLLFPLLRLLTSLFSVMQRMKKCFTSPVKSSRMHYIS